MTEPEIQKVQKLPDADQSDPAPEPVDEAPAEEASAATDDVADVDMDPSDHLNRPDQPDFDPAERRPYDDPAPDVLPTSEEGPGAG